MAYRKDGGRTYPQKYTPNSTTSGYEEAQKEKYDLKNKKAPQAAKDQSAASSEKKQTSSKTGNTNSSSKAVSKSSGTKSYDDSGDNMVSSKTETKVKVTLPEKPAAETSKTLSTIKAIQEARDEKIAMKSKGYDPRKSRTEPFGEINRYIVSKQVRTEKENRGV